MSRKKKSGHYFFSESKNEWTFAEKKKYAARNFKDSPHGSAQGYSS